MAVVFKNNAKTTLASGVNSSATSITVSDGSVFPSLTGSDIFFATLDDGTNNEIVKVTAVSSNTLTVVRAQESTTARSFSTGDEAQLRLTAGILGLFSQTGVAITDEIEAYLDANGLTFPDNVKAQFGTGSDLQIYHDGSNSFIQDSGTGNLRIAGQSVDILNPDANEFKARFVDNGRVELYYDNSKKFETTSTGIDVTGGATLTGNLDLTYAYPRINLTDTNHNSDYSIINNDGSFGIFDNTNSAYRLSINSSGNSTFSGTISSGDITITDTSTDPFLKLATSERQYVVRIDNSDADKFQIRDVTAGATRLSIDSTGLVTTVSDARVSGNLGVGRAPDAGFDLDVNGTSKFRGATTHNAGIQISNTTVIDASRNLTNIGTISATHSPVALASQPAIVGQFDSTGTDGLALIRVQHLSATTAAALGAGIEFKVGDGTSGSATKSSYIFQRGAGQTTMNYIADRNHQFYVDHHDDDLTGTNYSDYGTLALDIQESGEVEAKYDLDVHGNYRMDGTVIVDTSKNLTNIGTISSGAITTSGLLTVGGGAGAIKINESFITARSSDNANDINLIANINVFDADDVVIGSTSGQRFNDNIVFRTNGSQALRLDSSQNATFAGNISIGSGNETLHLATFNSGQSDITGLVGGSTFGSLITGGNNGHVVVRLADNDAGDSFSVISGGGNYMSDTTSDTLAFQVKVGGDATFGGTISATSYSGALASTVTATTQAASDNSTKVSTTAYVTTAIANLVDGAPSTLNTLNEIAAALNDDAALNTTLTNSIAGKLSLTGGTMTGDLNMGSKNITNIQNIRNNDIDFIVQDTTDSVTNFIWRDHSASKLYLGTADAKVELRSNLNLQSGHNIQMNGTTVIDNSRNLTNIGTISSGAITSSGDITLAANLKATGNNLKFFAGGNHIINMDLNGNFYPQTHNAVDLGFSDSLAFRNLHLVGAITGGATISSGAITSSGSIVTTSGNVQVNNGDFIANRTNNEFSFVQSASADSSSRGFIFQKAGGGNIAGQFRVNSAIPMRSANGYAVDSTTVIDSSRNLTNIGTYSGIGNSTFRGSGANSTNAFKVERASDNASALRILNSGEVVVENNYLYASHSGTSFYSQNTAVFRGNVLNDSGDLTLADDTNITGVIKKSGTTIVDASRNLTNIGTISSGAITSTGNLLLDSASAEINLKSGIGTESGAVNWTFNTTGTNFASIKLPYDTRATTGFHVDSGYPITLDATTRINFAISGNTRFRITNTAFEVGTTPIIDLNRNLTNIGTISSGKIGVGANTASYWSQANSLVLDDSGNTGLSIKSGTSGNGRVVFTDTTSTTAGLSDGGQIHYGHTNDDMKIRTAGADRVTINATGIDVTGSITSSGTISSGDIISTGILRSNKTSFPQLQLNDASNSVQIGHSGNNFFIKRGDNDGEIRFRNTDNTDPFIFDMTTATPVFTTTGNISVAGTTVLTGDTRIGSANPSGTHALKVYHTDNFEAAKFETNLGGSLARFTNASTSIEIGNQSGEAVLRTGNTVRLAANVNGDVRIATGHLQMGSTTIITSGTRNIQNIGTISSGTINAGNVELTSSGSIEIQRSGGAFIDFKESSVDFDSRIMGTSSLVFTTGGSGSTATALTLDSSQNATFAGTISSSEITFDSGTKIVGDHAVDGLQIRTQNTDAIVFKTNGNNKRFRIDGSGNFQVGTTTVIDSSRNLTNIGAISSGAITASGNIIAQSGGALLLRPTNSHDTDAWTVYQYTDNTLRMNFTGAGADEFTLSSSGNAAFTGTITAPMGRFTSNNDAAAGSTAHAFQAGLTNSTNIIIDNNEIMARSNGGVSTLHLNADGGDISFRNNQSGTTNLVMSGQTFMDQSRNLTNIGTISSGAITSTGTLANTGEVQIISGAGLTTHFNYQNGGNNIISQANGGATAFRNNGGDLFTIDSGGNLKLGSTQFISASRNLTNIGTISAGFTHLQKAGSSGVQTIVAVIGSTSLRPVLQFSESTATTINAGMSIEYNGVGTGATNYVSINSVAGASMFQFSSGGDFRIGSTTVIDSSRNLTNIGTISSGAITSSGNVTAFSDERLKQNIETLDSKKVLQMRGVSFIKDGVKGSGVIAQEIEEIAPELVLTADDEMGTKSVAYGNLVGYLIEAIKDQQKEIEYMKSELKTLKENNNGNK